MAEAERTALEGQNESQDSQAVIEYYHRQHGVGVVSLQVPQLKRNNASRKIHGSSGGGVGCLHFG